MSADGPTHAVSPAEELPVIVVVDVNGRDAVEVALTGPAIVQCRAELVLGTAGDRLCVPHWLAVNLRRDGIAEITTP